MTRVLGTTFDVRRYATDTATHVVVVSGKVDVRTGHRRAVAVAAGMMVVSADSTERLSTPTVTYNGWADGHLDFHDTPLPEALSILERWYGVRFRIADSALTHAMLVGRLDFKTTREAMQALQLMLGATMTYDRAGDTTIVTLHTRRTPGRSTTTTVRC